ncbi:hypothetical protein BX265_4941 [Streptomyces sp. TLI_235]|nr:hypothetical protein [Streptomyces sp. TLI_235]PBC80105.1 hypothetical protein BX265_4941 [Streptomyces sp. TLI_235]
MDPYRLVVADLRTDEVMDVLPIQGVTFDDYIGKSGSLSGTVPLPNADFARRARAVLLPGRTMLYLERADETVWGGPLWTRTPASDERGFLSCQVQAAGLESILRGHRLLSADQTFTSTDQLEIARQLVAYTQALSGGSLGIEIDYSQMSGVLRDRTYSRFDLPWIGGLLDQLAAVQGGFEWRIQIYKDSAGARHRALRLGYPQLVSGSEDVVLSSPAGPDGPGAVRSYSLPEDATTQANIWQSRGATTNQNQASASVPLMSAVQIAQSDLDTGWPRLDGTRDYTDVTVQATLDAYAAADLARWQRPVVIPTVKIITRAGQQPPLGSYVRLRITDDWYPAPGLIARYRVVGHRVEPEERGRPETCELYLEAA